MLTGLVALNHARAAEERQGQVRWLRPAYQNPDGKAVEKVAAEVALGDEAAAPTAPTAAGLPATFPDRLRAVRAALAAAPQPLPSEAIRARFKGARRDAIQTLPDSTAMGTAQTDPDGRYFLNR